MAAAILKAVEASINDPDGAYSISLDYVEGLEDADRDVQMEILKTSIDFWRPKGTEGTGELGKSDLDAWVNMQQVLIDMGLLSGSLDLEAAYTNEFVE